MMIAQLTNDNMFGRSVASRQHNMSSVFIAVENRAPVLLASNSGPSQIIDLHGRIVAEVPDLFEQGLAIAEIRAGGYRTFYSRFGDVFVLMLMIFLVLFSVLSMNKSVHNI